jgi:broad specificity phosphatase PhoE
MTAQAIYREIRPRSPDRLTLTTTSSLSLRSPPCLTTSSYVSPRRRAQRTFELLGIRQPHEPLPWDRIGSNDTPPQSPHPSCAAEVEVTEDIREWDYGEYEGITSPEIRELRKKQGLPETWDIWRDGCPGGE